MNAAFASMDEPDVPPPSNGDDDKQSQLMYLAGFRAVGTRSSRHDSLRENFEIAVQGPTETATDQKVHLLQPRTIFTDAS
jgi:hypothetical protein